MNVFDTHRRIVEDYAQYIRSFINISDPEIARTVEDSLSEGRLWPQPKRPAGQVSMQRDWELAAWRALIALSLIWILFVAGLLIYETSGELEGVEWRLVSLIALGPPAVAVSLWFIVRWVSAPLRGCK